MPIRELALSGVIRVVVPEVTDAERITLSDEKVKNKRGMMKGSAGENTDADSWATQGRTLGERYLFETIGREHANIRPITSNVQIENQLGLLWGNRLMKAGTAILRDVLPGSGAVYRVDDLGRRLKFPATAVNAEIAELEKVGYTIESHPHFGYRLLGTPDRLTADDIKAQLKTSLIGSEILVFQETASTNEVVEHLAKSGAREGFGGVCGIADARTRQARACVGLAAWEGTLVFGFVATNVADKRGQSHHGGRERGRGAGNPPELRRGCAHQVAE